MIIRNGIADLYVDLPVGSLLYWWKSPYILLDEYRKSERNTVSVIRMCDMAVFSNVNPMSASIAVIHECIDD